MSPIPVKLRRRTPFFIFLFLYLFFSFGTYRDYGMTWDEKDSYQGGAELFQCLVHGVKPAYLDPEHGYPYTCLLSFFSAGTHDEFFHLLNLIFALVLFWALFEALLIQYQKPWLALAGPVFLFLLPSFMGSVPANPKDIPFAVFYFLCLAAIYWFEQKLPDFKARWAVLGVLFAFAISSRIVGFTLFPILILFESFLFWSRKSKKKETKNWLWRKSKEWFGIAVTSQILCMALWPYLGEHYFQHLANVFWLSAHFPPRFDFLFMGGMTDSLTYPWTYLPVWIFISTPLFILGFLFFSIFLTKSLKTNQFYVLLIMALWLNLGLYFVLHPAIYDGLRHYLFLLPILAALAAIGSIEFFSPPPWTAIKKILGVLFLINAGTTGLQMIQLHPYEYVYFNGLVGGFKGAYGRFETDYWAASLKEAVGWLETNELKDPAKTYRIYLEGNPPQAQMYFSAHMENETVKQKADYAIVMTRAGIKPAPEDEGKIIHRVEREGAPLSFILKLK